MTIFIPRLPPHVTLIAVSKQQPDDKIDAALAAGLRIFGENKVQEAQKRWALRRTQHPDIKLHLVGPLQSNKAADAVALFDVVHTLDRPKIIHAVAHETKRQHKNISCFIQVNTGAEPQKSGILPQDTGALVTLAREAGLSLIGLMCIPPVDDAPAPHFTLLRDLARAHHLPCLSMGMSDDYDTAMACGATHIRVGSAIFGARPQTPRTE
jgi:pyridoxal phosphate enzyme (YggS family)